MSIKAIFPVSEDVVICYDSKVGMSGDHPLFKS